MLHQLLIWLSEGSLLPEYHAIVFGSIKLIIKQSDFYSLLGNVWENATGISF